MEIWERERMTEGSSKKIAAFDYFHIALITLSATTCGIPIA